MGKICLDEPGIWREIRKTALILKEHRQKGEDKTKQNKKTSLESLCKVREQGLIHFKENLRVVATQAIFWLLTRSSWRGR